MTTTTDLVADARAALLTERRRLTLPEIQALADLGPASTPALADLAHEVRPEDCQFCSQSAAFDTDVKATPFLDTDEVLAAARETEALGATEFCLVLAIKGPDEKTMNRLLELTNVIQTETSLNVAISAGILTDDQTRRLAEAGVHRYNHNLETAQSFFPQIVTTHTWEERLDTCQMVREHGMELCCGVLLGMGETDDQRVELIGQLMELSPAEVPINFLNPRPGTPLQIRKVTPATDAIRWIALFRLALPDVLLRYAGGREITLGDLQEAGMTSGINALIIGNYLTTLGRSPSEDLEMLERLQMPIAAVAGAI